MLLSEGISIFTRHLTIAEPSDTMLSSRFLSLLGGISRRNHPILPKNTSFPGIPLDGDFGKL